MFHSRGKSSARVVLLAQLTKRGLHFDLNISGQPDMILSTCKYPYCDLAVLLCAAALYLTNELFKYCHKNTNQLSLVLLLR